MAPVDIMPPLIDTPPGYERRVSGILAPRKSILPGMMPMPGFMGGAKIIDIAYRTSATAGSGTSATFSSLAIGAAASDRLVAALVASSSAASQSAPTSVTIGGVTATEYYFNGAADTALGLYVAAVPSGTTADVVVTRGSSVLGYGVDVFTITGHASAVPTVTSAAAPPGGVAVSASGSQMGLAGSTCRFTGSIGCAWTNATEQNEAIYYPTTHGQSCALIARGAGSVTVTPTWTNYFDGFRVVAAVWG